MVFGSRNDSGWERECGGGMMRKAVVSLGMACGDRVGCRLRETQVRVRVEHVRNRKFLT